MEGQPDGLQHNLGPEEYIRVPEPEDAIPLRLEEVCPDGVVRDLPGLGVPPTVELDDQVGLRAIKVDDVATHGLLSSELEAAKAAVANQTPKQHLSVRRLAS